MATSEEMSCVLVTNECYSVRVRQQTISDFYFLVISQQEEKRPFFQRTIGDCSHFFVALVRYETRGLEFTTY